MIKIHYPNGEYCFRALHTVHAVFRNDDGKLIARVLNEDNSALKEVEIAAFELIEAGVTYR